MKGQLNPKKNMSFTLGDLRPIPVKFSLKYYSIDLEKQEELELRFRPFELNDEDHLRKNYDDKWIQQVVTAMDVVAMGPLIFRQLDVPSKRKITSIKLIDIDEDGNEVEVAKAGTQKLLHLVQGHENILNIFKSFLACRGFSLPVLEAIADEMEGTQNSKKKVKGQDKKQTGSKSTTSLPANTTTQSTTL